MASALRTRSDHLVVLPLGLILIDILVEPGAMDPLNPIKLWALGFIGMWSFSNIATSTILIKRIQSEIILKVTVVLFGLFILFLLIASFLTSPKSIGFLGDTRRNIGFLNYFFLTLVAIYSTLKASIANIRQIYWTVLILCFFFSVYGLFQHFHKDIFKWNNQNNPIILTTGNPDFASSLLGLFFVICFTAIFIDFSKFTKLFLILLMPLTLLLIYWSQARQGLIAAAIGVGFIVTILVWQRRKKVAVYLFLSQLLLGIFSILGMLQVGPFIKYFYKASVNDRGYNWKAALAMFKHHPFFGVGVDRYGAYFLQYRDAKYALIYGYTQTVTNAHNVFLEIFATAGIFVGLLYILLTIFIGYRAFVAVKNNSGNRQICISGIVAGWIVFVAQSLISVDSLEISIWGWVLGGAIIGLSIDKPGSIPKSFTINRSSSNNILVNANLVFSLSCVALTFLILPMHRNEINTQKFLGIVAPTSPADEVLYKKAARNLYDQPLLNTDYKVAISAKMAQNSYGPEALHYFREALKADPRNASAHALISLVYENLKRPQEAIIYRKKLAILDPYGAENLLSLANDYLLTGEKSSAIAIRDSILAMAPGTDVAKRAAALITK